MSKTPLTVIRGDGIGPAIVDSALEVLDALDAEFDYEYVKVGQAALDDGEDDALPKSAIESIERTGLALKGPVTTPSGGGHDSVNVAIRKRFDLFANVRPAVSMAGAKPLYDDLDIIIVRENEHGMYSVRARPCPTTASVPRSRRSSHAARASGSSVSLSSWPAHAGAKKSRCRTRPTS